MNREKNRNGKVNKANVQFDKYISNLYYNPKVSGSFSSPRKIWEHIKKRDDKPDKLSMKHILIWYKKQDMATVFKQNRRKFKREKIISSAMDQCWELDLAQMDQLKKHNDGVIYLLVVIDIFSKYCWLRALKSKKGLDVANAMNDIFLEGRTPLRCRSDHGGEFKSHHFRALMKKNHVHLYHSYSEIHACFVERLIKTLKERIFKLIYDRQSYRYIDHLQDIAKSYNSTYHSTIKMAPSDVTKSNELDVYIKNYMPYVNKMAKVKPQFKFNVGDLVRLSYNRGKFTRAFHESFTEELFVVQERISSFPARYKLQDTLGDDVRGTFYEQELVFVHPDKNRVFKIEKVLSYRTRKNRAKEAKVRWLGYPPKYDSYILASQVKKYQKSSKQ